jgi:hypothetical protein
MEDGPGTVLLEKADGLSRLRTVLEPFCLRKSDDKLE